MLADGHYVDGSWLLTVHIDALNIDRQVRVKGDWSVGELLSELTEGLPAPVVKPPKPHEISLRSGGVRTGWGDHQLWWPAKSRWLIHSRVSLNQYGLQADALLRLVPIYGRLRIQLPDLQTRDFVDVNYVEPVFRVTVSICRQLNIRHPEELSLCYPITQTELKHTRFVPAVIDRRLHAVTTLGRRVPFQRSATINTTHTPTKQLQNYNSLNKFNKENSPEMTVSLSRRRSTTNVSQTSEHLFGPPRLRDRGSGMNGPVCPSWYRLSKPNSVTVSRFGPSFSPGSMHTLAFELRTFEDPYLASSPLIGVEEACQKGYLVRPNGFLQRLRLNSTWLDSARSLMEQGIDMSYCADLADPPPTSPAVVEDQHGKPDSVIKPKSNPVDNVPILWLRYKYGNFYDLNSKYDAVRINQLYEQAKWSVLTESIEATDDEACLLAALQAHIEISTEREEMTERDSTNVSSFAVNGHSASDGPKDSVSQVDGPSLSPAKSAAGASQSRDTSPIGGYLRHQQNHRFPRSTGGQSRPLSLVDLDSEIDALLDELANSCMNGPNSRRRSRSRGRSPRPLSQISMQPVKVPSEPSPPVLSGYVKVCKPRKFGLKVFKRLFLSIDGLRLLVFKNQDDYNNKSESPAQVIYLPGCEVQPDLCLSSERFSIRLFVPISKTNLPLSAAFGLNTSESQRADVSGVAGEDTTLGGRLRRRASLLSLTSLSPFGQVFGLQSPGGSSPNGLCGTSAAVLGLVTEIVLRFSDINTYIDWLALLRIATAIPVIGLLSGDDQSDGSVIAQDSAAQQLLTLSTYDAERKAISGLIRLIAPGSGRGGDDEADNTTSTLHFVGLHTRLERRLVDFLPMRISLVKGMPRQLEMRRDNVDASQTANTLPTDSRPPLHPSSGSLLLSQKGSFIRRICLAYSRIHQLTSIQAKLKYISAWEQMPNHGIAFFPARVEVTLPLASLFSNENELDPSVGGGRNTVPWMNRPAGGGHITVSSSRRIEAIGIGPTRVFRCELNTGDILASWRLSAIQGWHINWELGELVLLLASANSRRSTAHQYTDHETRGGSPPPAPHALSANTCAGRVIIRPVDVSVRILAEFLGGYAFLNLRSPEKNQGLDEGVFYKLTTGSSLPMTHAPVHGIAHN